MGLTQVSTDGVKNDAITKTKIPANQIEASELADNAVDTNAIADDAITTAKIATSAITNTEIATGTISASRIVSGGLTAATLANDAITTDKVADNAITPAKINVPLINRNLIINGAMQVSQRGTSFAAADSIYMLDRMFMEKSGNAANFTVTQSSTSPDGFAKSLKFNCTAADNSTGSNEFMTLRYKIEGQDLQHLGYGTSSAKATVLSFYVRSNVTGTYAVTVLQRDNSSKLYARTYTINSADTWERKTISIPGDTSGVINDDNGSGFEIYFPLVLGSNYKGAGVSPTWESFTNQRLGSQHGVNLGHSASNNWYLTGLQFEVGSVATDFEHRSLGEELVLCQRYYQQYVNPCCTGVIPDNGSKAYSIGLQFQTRMRAAPTLTTVNAGDGQNISDGQNSVNISSLNAADRNVDGASIYLNLASDLGDFRPACLGRNDSTTHTTTYKFSAEL